MGIADELVKLAKAESAARRGDEPRVFDWDKAARILSERKPASAGAGLSGDWSHTGGDIWRDGKPLDRSETYVYLASNWATPMLRIDDDEDVECWKYESETPGWDASTYWPESALALLSEKPSPPPPPLTEKGE